MKTIAVLATLDTKSAEAVFLCDEIVAQGGRALLMDLGVMGEPGVAADLTRDDVARAGGSVMEELRRGASRQHAAPVLAAGAIALLRERIARGEVHGALGLGGTQGTSLCGQIMQALPYGFPKFIVSTVASGDTSPFVGIKDITMMFAVADILGLNPVLRKILSNAAGGVLGMAQNSRSIARDAGTRGTIAMTNLGVLTRGAMRAIERFHAAGYEVITFHAIGAGGRAMEQMMREGLITGVFDYALGEIADELFGGLRAADPTRLTAAGLLGLPQVVCPGGAEHIGLLLREANTPPPAYAGRRAVFHSPLIFAPRLNEGEIVRVAREITQRLGSTRGRCVFLIPRRGVSRYSIAGAPLEDAASDAAFFRTLRETMPPGVELRELDAAAEDDAFVDEAVRTLLALIEQPTERGL